MVNARLLTKGKPWKLLLGFSVPILVGQIFQLLYSLFDTKIVGALLGEGPLAAVGSISSLYNLMNTFANGLTMGFSIMLAFYFGARNFERVKKTFATTIYLSLGTIVALIILIMVFLQPIQTFLNIPDAQKEMATAYIQVLVVGMIVTVMYHVCANSLRAIGDSVTPLIFLIVASLSNVGMDYVFIRFFHWGVAGAAYATVFAQLLSVILCLIRIVKKFELLHLQKSDFKPERKLVTEMMKSGLSVGLMGSLVALGTVTLQSSINGLGAQFIVTQTAARKVCEMMMLPQIVVGYAMTTFAGQNSGAGRPDRVRTGLKSALIMGVIWNVIVAILMFTISRYLIGFLTSSSDETILYWGSLYLKFELSFNMICYVIIVLRNMLQGLGSRVAPVVSSAIELAGKIVFTFMLVPVLGYWGVILTEPVIWIVMVIPLIIKTKKMIGQKA
ncbi:MAG: MATE family efflux transporter [Eubacterium sp.]|nr:MATE family efflux transporter [Eubacterium sp.]